MNAIVPYDSLKDTYEHIMKVQQRLREVIDDLLDRSAVHDQSKTQEPEKEVYDQYTPALKSLTYGTKAYKEVIAKMGYGVTHHYQVNRHHPEFFVDGINGMSLLDMMEMLADWKAATERMKNGTGDLKKSIEINAERFNMDDSIKQVLLNTASYLGWI